MTQLFDRRCQIFVGRLPTVANYALEHPTGLVISGLRCAFKVVRDDQPQPSVAEVSIWNLSKEHRAQLEGVGQRFLILAGYPGTEAQIFSGDIRHADSEKQGPDWVTKLQGGDGERSYAGARVNASFKGGSGIADMVASVLDATGLDVAAAKAKVRQLAGSMASGYSMHAKASTELTRLLDPHGWTWSIQDGRVEVLGPGETVNDSAPLISPETGLVGSPAYGSPEKPGKPALLKVKSLLQPRLRPGQKFQLKSASFDGVFVCRKVTHQGDTHGQDFYSEIEATKT